MVRLPYEPPPRQEQEGCFRRAVDVVKWSAFQWHGQRGRSAVLCDAARIRAADDRGVIHRGDGHVHRGGVCAHRVPHHAGGKEARSLHPAVSGPWIVTVRLSLPVRSKKQDFDVVITGREENAVSFHSVTVQAVIIHDCAVVDAQGAAIV
jgi:hypothetical protein